MSKKERKVSKQGYCLLEHKFENNLNCMAEVRGMIIEISGVYYSKKGTRELSRKIDTMLG